MENSVHVLCYHRVLAEGRSQEDRPYYARGTAITKSAFMQHIRDLRAHFDFLSEALVHDVLTETVKLRRPGCWITFDDAYVDIADTVAPILEEFGIPATVFVSTSVLDGAVLPVDRWYATLNSAKRMQGLVFGHNQLEFNLDEQSSYARFIDGPEKRQYLRSTHEQQEVILHEIAAALDAETTMPRKRLYLNSTELIDLTKRGWSVGSHSKSHSILPFFDKKLQQNELFASRKRLREIMGIPPKTFAYPDGTWDSSTKNLVEKAKYLSAVTLVANVARPNCDLFAIPRIIARNDANFIQSLISPKGVS